MDDTFQVNTHEVRQIAAKIARISAQVQGLGDNNVRAMRATVEETMKGEAADALQDVLENMRQDIDKIASGLATVQRTLEQYARQVDITDEKLSQLF